MLLLNKHGQHLAQKELFVTYTSIVFIFSSPSVIEVNPINADSGNILLSLAVLFNRAKSVTPRMLFSLKSLLRNEGEAISVGASILFSVISLSRQAGDINTGRTISGVAFLSDLLLYKSALATDSRLSSSYLVSFMTEG